MADETKVALITGSSSGIGEAAAKLLCKNGYRVAICGSNEEKVNRVVEQCSQLTNGENKPIGLVLDFSVAENGAMAVEQTLAHFNRLDVLVNNAGIFKRTALEDPACYETYKNMMTINLDATVKCSLAAVEALKKTQGNMVFISSNASTLALGDTFGYCATKAAMSMFAKCLAIDLAPHVRVNVISPGPVLTDIISRSGVCRPEMSEALMRRTMKDFTLLERIGEADEIGEAILFVISNKCSFINGHEMFIDGGLSLKRNIKIPKSNE